MRLTKNNEKQVELQPFTKQNEKLSKEGPEKPSTEKSSGEKLNEDTLRAAIAKNAKEGYANIEQQGKLASEQADVGAPSIEIPPPPLSIEKPPKKTP